MAIQLNFPNLPYRSDPVKYPHHFASADALQMPGETTQLQLLHATKSRPSKVTLHEHDDTKGKGQTLSNVS